ncbi:hypothetical protein B7P43_G14331 [Cryptotermes secundus]|nr:hypothetical protein B7P43_G14331 [Cryptotermes secundus]
MNLVICGDINTDYLIVSDRRRQLDALLLSYNLRATVNFPTRVHNHTSTAIDNIFIDKQKFIKYSVSPLYNGLSDHDAQLLFIKDIDTQIDNHSEYYTRSINKYSVEEFKNRLSYESWDSIFNDNGNDVDVLFNTFMNNYLRIVHTSFPLRKVSRRNNNRQWITIGIKTSCNHKRQLYLLCKNSNDVTLKRHYKQYCKILTRVIIEAKKTWYNKQINNSSNKMKTAWNIIRSVTNRKEDHTASKHENSPDAFNDYFLTIAEHIAQKIKNRDTGSSMGTKNISHYLSRMSEIPFPDIKFKNTTTIEIERIINSIRTKNSHGYDGITTKMLKVSTPFISSPLNYICNKSITLGIFPTRLKYSIMKPLFKKGDKRNIANYRPISLLTTFSKVFEKIIYQRLLQHIEGNNILVNEQFGFRPTTSTDNASYKLINEIMKAMNEKKVVGGIFCDLQKAFDCVNHDILLTKLEFYGIRGIFLKLMKSYLEGRHQKVVLDNNSPEASSNWGEIKHGVPQGSILGPLLFLLYVNDLPKIGNNKAEMVLYADDTSIIVKSLNLTDFTNCANKILQDMKNWFTTNLLSLNEDKTQYMQFVTKRSSLVDLHVMYESREIANTSNVKFLGLTLDSTFSWKNHIDAIIPKLSSACFAVRAIKPFLSLESLKSVYFSYFHSIMTYGLIFWGNCYYSNTIFKLQKRIIRIMVGIGNRKSCREYFKKLNILPLQSQYIYLLLIFVIKNSEHFKRNSQRHNRDIRNSLDMHYPRSHLSLYQKGLHYTGIKVFNRLPAPIKLLSNDIKQFKSALREFLYLYSFYSLEEYFNIIQ